MELSGATALVTGASRGLGKATALALGAAGANVIVNYLQSDAEAEQVAREIAAMGGKAEAVRTDVTRPEEVNRLAEFVYEKYGNVDVLVNNAGAIPRPGSWDEITDGDMRFTIDSNLVSVLNCLRAFTPKMVQERSGRIVNLASTYGLNGAAPVMAYTAAKAGVINVTYGMARELGRHNVTVNCVCPGNFATDMAAEAGPEFVAWAESTTPLGRLGRPEEIADAVVFLARSDFITGSVLVVDGGHSLGYNS